MSKGIGADGDVDWICAGGAEEGGDTEAATGTDPGATIDGTPGVAGRGEVADEGGMWG